MAVQPTQAASELQSTDTDVSSHKLISLLMAGTLERVSQAKACIDAGNHEDKIILMHKIQAIINGLHQSLNFSEGGDIAVNLSNLYNYMLLRIEEADSPDQEKDVLSEIANLVVEIKQGWDHMPEFSACA